MKDDKTAQEAFDDVAAAWDEFYHALIAAWANALYDWRWWAAWATLAVIAIALEVWL